MLLILKVSTFLTLTHTFLLVVLLFSQQMAQLDAFHCRFYLLMKWMSDVFHFSFPLCPSLPPGRRDQPAVSDGGEAERTDFGPGGGDKTPPSLPLPKVPHCASVLLAQTQSDGWWQTISSPAGEVRLLFTLSKHRRLTRLNTQGQFMYRNVCCKSNI